VWLDKRKWLVHGSPVFKCLFEIFGSGCHCNTTVERLHFERKFVNTDPARAARRSLPEAAVNIINSNIARVASAQEQLMAQGDPLSRRAVLAFKRAYDKHAAAQQRLVDASDAADGKRTPAVRTAEKRLASMQKATADKEGAAADEAVDTWGAKRGKPVVPVGARGAPASVAPLGGEGEADDDADDDADAADADADADAAAGSAEPMADTSKQAQLAAAKRALEANLKRKAKAEETAEKAQRSIAASETRVALLEGQVTTELMASKVPALTDLPAGRDAAAAPLCAARRKCSMRGCLQPPLPGCAYAACSKYFHCRGQHAIAAALAAKSGEEDPPRCTAAEHQAVAPPPPA